MNTTKEEQPPKCVVDPVIMHSKNTYTHYYFITHSDDSTIRFSCIYNYHLVSGNTMMTCLRNGSWVGTPPHCEVDYYKEKTRLSLFIIGVSLVIPCLLLLCDFFFYHRRKALARSNVTREFNKETQRIIGEPSVMSMQALQEAIDRGVFSEQYIRGGMSFLSTPKMFNTPRTSQFYRAPDSHDFTPKPSVRSPKGKSRVWYEPDSRNTPQAQLFGGHRITMFGAGRHLGAIGAKFWNL